MAGAFDTAAMTRKLKQLILSTSIQNLRGRLFLKNRDNLGPTDANLSNRQRPQLADLTHSTKC